MTRELVLRSAGVQFGINAEQQTWSLAAEPDGHRWGQLVGYQPWMLLYPPQTQEAMPDRPAPVAAYLCKAAAADDAEDDHERRRRQTQDRKWRRRFGQQDAPVVEIVESDQNEHNRRRRQDDADKVDLDVALARHRR